MKQKKGKGGYGTGKTGRKIEKNYKGLITSEEALLKLIMLAMESYGAKDLNEGSKGEFENEN